jgi:hypothetical protein
LVPLTATAVGKRARREIAERSFMVVSGKCDVGYQEFSFVRFNHPRFDEIDYQSHSWELENACHMLILLRCRTIRSFSTIRQLIQP